MKILTFLHLHLNKRHTPQEWATLLEIEIIDPDGWRGHRFDDFNQPVDLEEFTERIARCTIAPVNAARNPDIILNRDLPKAGKWTAPDNIRALQEVAGGF